MTHDPQTVQTIRDTIPACHHQVVQAQTGDGQTIIDMRLQGADIPVEGVGYRLTLTPSDTQIDLGEYVVTWLRTGPGNSPADFYNPTRVSPTMRQWAQNDPMFSLLADITIGGIQALNGRE